MARGKNKVESKIWFKYTYPIMSQEWYSHLSGKTFDAQVMMINVEAGTARVRLYENNVLVVGNFDISAQQFFEQMQVVPVVS
jgi:hypothetical protein